MDGLFSTIIILILGVGLAITVYFLYNGKPSFTGRKTNNGSMNDDNRECTDYKLVYKDENPYATEGPTELIVEISDANDPGKTAISKIYHDKQLVSGVVTFGRDATNNYSVSALNVDRYNAFYLAKAGNEYKIKANPKSRNGLSETYKGRRIDKTISFEQSITLFMGDVKFSFSVPGVEPEQISISRESIFSDDEDSKTKIFRR